MTIGTRNVRSLLDVNNYRPERRTALITQELARLDTDIAALSETRLSGEGQISEVRSGYTIFWKEKDAGATRIHGAGFAVKTKIVKDLRLTSVSINERLMTLRVPFGSYSFITFVSAYAPTLDSDEDTMNQFYHQLNSTVSKIPIKDKLILLGDFNARVGRDNRFWRDVMGKQGVGNCNANGLLLLGLCAEHELFISSTQFRLPNRYETTWMQPRSKHWHLIDYVITRQRDKKDILITKAALNIDECWTDHRLLVSRLRVPKYRKPRSRFSNPPRRKFNTSNLNNKNVRSHFQDIIFEQLKAPVTTDDVEQEWTTLKNIIKETAENVVGFSARKRSDWFDDNHGEIQAIINAKRDAYLSLAQDPSCAEKKAHFQELKQKCQSEIRAIKNKWWQQKATELQNLSDARNLRGFYAGIKELYGPIRSSSGTLKAADNSTILTEIGGYPLKNII
ncbi:craniofacial development protein 2-like [Schistocerca americana]|uniref:craniofacial development protein 2-like n=1 Tax=Schistocerca americana TaxID=7009 RepID=UPI001F4FC527|nr:craniofacial development protein 2-like [Schistocerca americana]